jgi:hypothetical protein
LTPWEGSVTCRGGVPTSTGGEATARRGKGGEDVGWTDVNLTGLKNEENSRVRFSCG